MPTGGQAPHPEPPFPSTPQKGTTVKRLGLPADVRKQALTEAALIVTVGCVAIVTNAQLDSVLPDNPPAVLLSLFTSVGAGALAASVLDDLRPAIQRVTGRPAKPGETSNRNGIPKP